MHISEEKPNSLELINFLTDIDDYFSPPLSNRVDLQEYAEKIIKLSEIYSVKDNNEIIALVSTYLNNNSAYITLFAIKKNFHGQGISYKLFDFLRKKIKEKSIDELKLEVYKNNIRAIRFYQKLDFNIVSENKSSYFMSRKEC